MDVHGRDDASIADPSRTIAVDVMEARETQELTLTTSVPRERKKKPAIASGRLSRQIAVLLVSGGVLHGFCRRVIN